MKNTTGREAADVKYQHSDPVITKKQVRINTLLNNVETRKIADSNFKGETCSA